MSLRSTTLLTALAPLALLGVATAAVPASAAPFNGNTFLLDLSCSDGSHYAVTLVDHTDDAAPAHLVDSPGVLIPTAFTYHITVLDAEGAVVDDFTTPPASVHGRSGANLDTMTCTFAQTETEDVPGVGEVTVVIEGTVDAFRPR